MVGLATFDSVGDLLDATGVETLDGSGGDPAVVVGANNAWVALVDRAAFVDRIVDDVVEELVLADRTINILVVDEVAT